MLQVKVDARLALRIQIDYSEDFILLIVSILLKEHESISCVYIL